MVVRKPGGQPLAPELIEAILHRLAAGQSVRGIHRQLRVSKAVVRLLRDGKHVSQRRGLRWKRCGCGALTDVQPCRACQLRQSAAVHEPP